MSDDLPKKPQTKPISNSLKLRAYGGGASNKAIGRHNVAAILQRLPFVRQLDLNQNALLSLTPVWQTWCNTTNQVNIEHSSGSNALIEQSAALANFDNGTLTIACKNSSVASLLKHQQASLLDAYNKSGFSQVKKLKIQMALNAHKNHDLQQTEAAKSKIKADRDNLNHQRSKPSAASIKSIEATQSLTDNEQLAASLKRLAETLKKDLK